MMSKAKQATKAEKERMQAIVEIGCVMCIMDGAINPPRGTVHHLLDHGFRRGHAFTVSGCEWHHLGIPPGGYSDREAEEIFGPSLAKNGKAFKQRYGSDDSILSFQEELLKQPVTR